MANVSFPWNGSSPDPDRVDVVVVIMVMESPHSDNKLQRSASVGAPGCVNAACKLGHKW